MIQSNIGGPNKSLSELRDIARDWVSGELPGCSCLICSKVPKVLKKLDEQSKLTPHDVLPLTTIPRLQLIVDEWLRPKYKFAFGSQGYLGQEGQYQIYPSAAVGFLNYPKIDSSFALFYKSTSLDPWDLLTQQRAPRGYDIAQHVFWEQGRTLQRDDDDPDMHVFGFIYVKIDSLSSLGSQNDLDAGLAEELGRFRPKTDLEVPRGELTLPQ